MDKEFNKQLAVSLGNEIILGCDCFDVDDVWEVISGYSIDNLKSLERQVREYIYAKWPREAAALYGIWNEDFLNRQMKLWIYQNTWRNNIVNQ